MSAIKAGDAVLVTVRAIVRTVEQHEASETLPAFTAITFEQGVRTRVGVALPAEWTLELPEGAANVEVRVLR